MGKKNDLEAYLGGLAKKFFIMLEGNLSYPTDLLSSTYRSTAGLSLNCVYRILPKFRGGDQSSGDKLGPYHGIVTSDVLVKALSCGAITTRKLEGVNRDKGHEVYTGSSPYG